MIHVPGRVCAVVPGCPLPVRAASDSWTGPTSRSAPWNTNTEGTQPSLTLLAQDANRTVSKVFTSETTAAEPRLRNNRRTLKFTGIKPPNRPARTAAALSLISPLPPPPPPSPWPSDVASAQDRKRRLLLWVFAASGIVRHITAILWWWLVTTSTWLKCGSVYGETFWVLPLIWNCLRCNRVY